MNRTCNGNFFTIKKKRYYRCLRDGVSFKTQIINNDICPICNRKIDGTNNKEVHTIKEILTSVFLPKIGWCILELEQSEME